MCISQLPHKLLKDVFTLIGPFIFSGFLCQIGERDCDLREILNELVVVPVNPKKLLTLVGLLGLRHHVTSLSFAGP